MRRVFCCCLLTVIATSLKSQTVRTPLSNHYTRTNTYSHNNRDAFSFAGNQAALAGINNISVGVYGERRYMIDDLNCYELAFALPTASGNFGASANYFGSGSYNESKLGLAYGRSAGNIDVGVQFNYYSVSALGYGASSAVNFEGGAILHVTEQFRTGFHIYNPLRVDLGKNSEEKLPVIYSLGMGYDPSEKFFIGAVIEKIEDQPVSINAGVQYSFAEKLFARMGVVSGNSSFYIGVGYVLSRFRIDITASVHQSMGTTPGLLLIYNVPEAK